MKLNKFDQGSNHMTSNQSTLAAAAREFFRILAVCLPVLMLLTSAQAQHSEPSDGAKGMPGAQGTIEFKPTDWKGNVTTYWKDSDGINPGVAGCHIGVTKAGKRNGRSFGEACQSDRILIESNPGKDEIHPHTNDLGHPDTFDCNAWCIGAKKTQGGVCKAVSGPRPCATSARCECK
jgi:hypothetical protein